MTGTVTGIASGVDSGVLVKTGKTVIIDDVSLSKEYNTSGTLTSSIFDSDFTIGAAWGTLTYSSSGSTVAVKARTSNDSGMSGAIAFASCTAITSASDISSNSCVTDGQRYIQYQLTLSTSDTATTPTFSDISIGFTTFDADAPSISLTALTPDPNSDNTPTLSGTTTEGVGTVSTVQFQMDSTSGSWSSCTATDESFNSASESFTCTPSSALSDGSHTMYVRATDSNGNTTSSGYASDAFTIDATNPVSIDLDSPGDNSYTNSERPTYKWKATTDATAGLSKYVLEIDNPSIGSSQPSGDFSIDNIPTSGTTDITSNNKYVIHFDGFSDSDTTNNYISVYTKSHSDWGSSENDGKLREGRVSWKVKARDNAGNETSSSRTLFVDRTSPNVEFTQVNGIATSQAPRNDGMTTTDHTPTIFGKITDLLAGGDSIATLQNDSGPRVASGPKSVEIKIEKVEKVLGVVSNNKLITIYTINMDKALWTCTNKEITDNSKQKCGKYLPFSYTPENALDLGQYKITLSGKDKADNSSSETILTLNITTLSQITTPAEKKAIEEALQPAQGEKQLTPEQQEQVKQELEITKPTEEVPTSALEKLGNNITKTTSVIASVAWQSLTDITNKIASSVNLLVMTIGDVFNGVGSGVSFAYNTVNSINVFVNDKTFQGLAFIGNGISTGVSNIAQGIGSGYNSLAQHAPGDTKNILLAIGNGFSTTTGVIASGSEAISNTGKIATSSAYGGLLAMTRGAQNGIANIAFTVGVKVDDVSHGLGTAIIKIGYLFVPEPTKISDVQVIVLSPTSAKISWKTNHPANGKVNYGLDETYPFDVQTEKRTNDHEFTLTNLKSDTEYYFEVMSQNRNYVYDANRKFKTPKK